MIISAQEILRLKKTYHNDQVSFFIAYGNDILESVVFYSDKLDEATRESGEKVVRCVGHSVWWMERYHKFREKIESIVVRPDCQEIKINDIGEVLKEEKELDLPDNSQGKDYESH